MARWWVLICFFLCSPAGFAADLSVVLAPPAGGVAAGRGAVFSIYFNNSGENTETVDLQNEIICRLLSAGKTRELTARAEQPPPVEPLAIPPGGFAEQRYSVDIPSDLQGPVTVEFPAFGNLRTMVTVGGEAAAPEAGADQEPTIDICVVAFQTLTPNLFPYQPMYFLVGTDPENSKFQLSFKYRFINEKGPLAQQSPWLKGFYFGYTQTSFWDLGSTSRPFNDTSYKPEFIFVTPNLHESTWTRGLFLQTGVEHESNGKGGLDSRNTNYVYLWPHWQLGQSSEEWALLLAPKVWLYFSNGNDTNPDLEDYWGYFDFQIKLGLKESFVLDSHFQWAKEGGGIQLDLTYPLNRLFFRNLDIYLQAQYFNGVGESFLKYTERSRVLRFGVAIVR